MPAPPLSSGQRRGEADGGVQGAAEDRAAVADAGDSQLLRGQAVADVADRQGVGLAGDAGQG